MVNSPVISMADSASGWSSSGVAQPPRIPSRSLLTVPPGVVEHPHAVLGRPFLSSDSPGWSPSGPGPSRTARTTRVRATRDVLHPSLIIKTAGPAGPSLPTGLGQALKLPKNGVTWT